MSPGSSSLSFFFDCKSVARLGSPCAPRFRRPAGCLGWLGWVGLAGLLAVGRLVGLGGGRPGGRWSCRSVAGAGGGLRLGVARLWPSRRARLLCWILSALSCQCAHLLRDNLGHSLGTGTRCYAAMFQHCGRPAVC